MSDPYPVHLGSAPLRADPHCAFCPEESGPPCGAPATCHIRWTPDLVDALFSLVCDAHMDRVRQNLVYVDRHPATVNCDMPGFGWQLGEPSYCVSITTEDVAALPQRGEQ